MTPPKCRQLGPPPHPRARRTDGDRAAARASGRARLWRYLAQYQRRSATHKVGSIVDPLSTASSLSIGPATMASSICWNSALIPPKQADWNRPVTAVSCPSLANPGAWCCSRNPTFSQGMALLLIAIHHEHSNRPLASTRPPAPRRPAQGPIPPPMPLHPRSAMRPTPSGAPARRAAACSGPPVGP